MGMERSVLVIAVVLASGCFGGGSGGADIATCKKDCDDGKFFSCISATEQTQCRAQCGTVEARARSEFVACWDASAPACDPQCFAHLGITVGSGSGSGSGGTCADVMECQTQCGALSFFNCIDAAQLSACRARCTTASNTSCSDFSACIGSQTQCPVLLDCLANFH